MDRERVLAPNADLLQIRDIESDRVYVHENHCSFEVECYAGRQCTPASRRRSARCSRAPPCPMPVPSPVKRDAGQLPCAVRVTSAVRAGWWPPEASKLVLLVCLWLRVPPPCPGCRRGRARLPGLPLSHRSLAQPEQHRENARTEVHARGTCPSARPPTRASHRHASCAS
jgi:hypothetical protein